MVLSRASLATRFVLLVVVCLGLTGCDGCKKKQIPVTQLDAPAALAG